MKHDERSHFGIGLARSRRWPNAYFAKAGLSATHTAWQSARQSRWRNHRPQSRMRENRPSGSQRGV